MLTRKKTFVKKFGKPAEVSEEYPPKAEGVGQLVLAPSMQRIKSILPRESEHVPYKSLD